MHLQLPSPIEQLTEPLYEEMGVQVFVKRDDLIHPLISGNKWRKLKYTLEKASKEGKKHLVTFGGAYSNHVVATAAAAQTLGLQASAIIRGEDQQNEVLTYCRSVGMQLLFVDRASYTDKNGCIERFYGGDSAIFVIPEGGASSEGVQGCEEILAENSEHFDHIFCAAGTGTTAAGLYSYIQKQELNSTLHVVPVLKGGHFIQEEIAKHLPIENQLALHTSYHFGGYGKSTAELLRFIISFYKMHKVLLDQVYTAKLVFGLHDLISKGYFARGTRILWLHTGGLTGLHGVKTKLERIDTTFAELLDKNFN
ncbi:MAG: 1-aminocyclopropane-1-carboxylate deaminase/D-cysteine desulfhydrase [Sphingobacteriaceae bacterium]